MRRAYQERPSWDQYPGSFFGGFFGAEPVPAAVVVLVVAVAGSGGFGFSAVVVGFVVTPVGFVGGIG